MDKTSQQSTEIYEFGNEKIEVIFRKVKPIEDSGGRFPPLAPGVIVKNGIRIERDVAVWMRDGITIYIDIYRPEGATNIPAILSWSPYGKSWAGPVNIGGVPPGAVSPMAKFEGPDPAYWCKYGYAVINADARGAGNSEGDIRYWGTGEGQDCHDTIEWVAARDWCNGKVAMSGNSWLAISPNGLPRRNSHHTWPRLPHGRGLTIGTATVFVRVVSQLRDLPNPDYKGGTVPGTQRTTPP